MRWYSLVLGVLAVWRLTHLLSAEDGPGQVLVRLRRLTGEGFWGSLLDCFYCLSLWLSLPAAFFLGAKWSERFLLWLAISGGACLLERATAPNLEFKEDNHVLLRQGTSTASPTGDDGPVT